MTASPYLRSNPRQFAALMKPAAGEVQPALAILVLCLVLFNAVLSTAAMTCFPLVEGTSQHHQHTHNSDSHALHCAWGCSFIFSPSLPSLTFAGWVWLCIARLLTTVRIRRRFCPFLSVCQRGPPRIFAC